MLHAILNATPFRQIFKAIDSILPGPRQHEPKPPSAIERAFKGRHRRLIRKGGWV